MYILWIHPEVVLLLANTLGTQYIRSLQYLYSAWIQQRSIVFYAAMLHSCNIIVKSVTSVKKLIVAEYRPFEMAIKSSRLLLLFTVNKF